MPTMNDGFGGAIVGKGKGRRSEHFAPLSRAYGAALATVAVSTFLVIAAGAEWLVQLGVGAFTVLALALETRYLFWPAIRALRDHHDRLESAGSDTEIETLRLSKEIEKLLGNLETLQGVTSGLEAANMRIEGAAKRFEELFQGLPIACLGYDASGAVMEWNRASEEMFGDATKLFGIKLYDLLNPVHEANELREMTEQVFKGKSFRSISLACTGDGVSKFYLCSTFPVHGANGQVNGAIFACVDVTAQKEYEKKIEEHLTRINEYSVAIEQQKWELQEANDRLQSLARQDGLTGLFNHRSFQEALARDVRRAERESGTVSIVLIDVDNFKKYNDSFGHPAGDALLKHFSQLLLACSRESDLVARYGGEEFVVILPATDVDGANLAAERMRSAIENAVWPNRQVTASFGVATMDKDLSAPDVLIAAADKALYASKAAGRNACTHWNELKKAA